jgi:hypothetical protein
MTKGPMAGKKYPILEYMDYGKLSPDQRKYSLALSTIYEPQTYDEASKHPDWCKAMDSEYQTLVSNNTWTVSPLLHRRNIWLANGSLRSNFILVDQKKGRKPDLLPMDSHNKLDLIMKKPSLLLPS